VGDAPVWVLDTNARQGLPRLRVIAGIPCLVEV
jgi:hypothetical protein